MKIQESAENYLETVLILMERNGQVRSIDIANELGFSKPSVSIAMKQLEENGYIRIDEPTPAPAIGGRRVVFLMHPAAGMLELLEEK